MLFKDNYFFLSNFSPCIIKVNINNKDLIFSSVEAAYQAHKNYSLADRFILLQPLEAKKFGRKVPLTTENWDTEKLYIMAKLLNQKFRDLEHFLKLKSIKDEIVEDNYWHDTTWGKCKGEGHNFLGKLLMCIRDTNNDINKINEYISEILLKEM